MFVTVAMQPASQIPPRFPPPPPPPLQLKACRDRRVESPRHSRISRARRCHLVLQEKTRRSPDRPSYPDQSVNPKGLGMQEGPHPPSCCPIKEAQDREPSKGSLPQGSRECFSISEVGQGHGSPSSPLTRPFLGAAGEAGRWLRTAEHLHAARSDAEMLPSGKGPSLEQPCCPKDIPKAATLGQALAHPRGFSGHLM